MPAPLRPKRYLTRAEQRRVLRKLRTLEKAVHRRNSRSLYVDGQAGPYWFLSVRAHVRSGYLFCADVPALARLFRRYNVR